MKDSDPMFQRTQAIKPVQHIQTAGHKCDPLTGLLHIIFLTASRVVVPNHLLPIHVLLLLLLSRCQFFTTNPRQMLYHSKSQDGTFFLPTALLNRSEEADLLHHPLVFPDCSANSSEKPIPSHLVSQNKIIIFLQR